MEININYKTIKKSLRERFFSVDQTRFALVSLRVDGRILLHETTGPGPHQLGYQKEKEPAINEFFFRHADRPVVYADLLPLIKV